MKIVERGMLFLVLLLTPWIHARADITTTATITPTPSSTPNSIAVSCIDDSGNATGGGGGCNAILPKCSDLKTSYEKNVKNFLSWKIWGYYQGKNIDLDSSSLSATSPTLVGPSLAYPICSIVGHKMQMASSPSATTYGSCDKSRSGPINAYTASGLEYSAQTIGNLTSCGKRPDALTGDMAITLQFANGSGNQWDSWLIGAYPWLIRRYASDVLTQIKPDLSNLADVISDPSVKADMATMNGKMTTYYANLSTESQAVCTAANSDVVTRCNNGTMNLSDPANRLCTLVKAQAALNSGSLPNIIVKEIMSRVQTNYDLLFDNLMTFSAGPGQTLWGKCANTGSLFRAGAKKKAMSASCLFDGGDFYAFTANGKPALENDCSASSHHASMGYNFGIGDGGVGGGQSAGRTIMYGFGGLVEYNIRHNICQQNAYTDASVCDSINIPDKPAGIQ